MDIKKLEVGMVFKNYKELCKFIKEKEKAGNSKNKQLKEWSRFFEFEKDKYGFKIIKIYEKPRLLTTEQHLQNLLLVNLVKSREMNKDKKCVIMGSKMTFYNMLSLVNEQYKKYRFNPSGISQDFDINEDNAMDLCEIVNNTLSYKLKALLNKLEREGFIIKEEVYVGYTENEEGLCEAIAMTDIEKDRYMEIRTKVLKDIGCKELKQIFVDKKLKKYNHLLSERLEEEFNLKFVHKSYKVFFHDKYLKGKVRQIYKQYTLTEDTLKYEIGIINDSFTKQIKENGVARNKQACKSTKNIQEYKEFTEWYDDSVNKLLRRSEDSYLEDIDKFIKGLIEINGLGILKDMKDIASEKDEDDIFEMF